MVQLEHGNLAFDSERQYIGTVYAKSLLGAAEKADAKESVLEEFDSVMAVLGKLPGLQASLASPRIAHEEKESLIDKAFQGGSKTLINFLKVVCQHGRFDSIRVIHRAAHAMHDEATGRVEVTLVTAEAVDEGMEQKVIDRLSSVLSKKVRLQTQVDPGIIGGLVVRVGDTVYDGSLANQLQQVKKTAINQAIQEIRQSMDRFVVEA